MLHTFMSWLNELEDKNVTICAEMTIRDHVTNSEKKHRNPK